MDPNIRKRKLEVAENGKEAEFAGCDDLYTQGMTGEGPTRDGQKLFSQGPGALRLEADNGPLDGCTTPKKARFELSSPLSSPESLTDAESVLRSPTPSTTPHNASPSARSGSPKPSPIKKAFAAASKQSSLSSFTTPQSTPSATTVNGTTSAPAKRKRMTAAEKKVQDEEKEKKLQEKAQKKKEAEDKKVIADAEKEQKRKEREESKAKVEAEKQLRAQERETKRQKKEEEERKVVEEKEKKARSQLKLNSFFKLPSTPAKKAQAAAPEDDADTTTNVPAKDGELPQKSKPEVTTSTYDKLFKPFFVKSGMHMASSPFSLDDDTKELKSRILDEYISGKRDAITVARFNPVEALNLVTAPKPRGHLHEPVRQTVAQFHLLTQKAEKSGDLTEQEAILRDTRKRLARVPLKSLRFQQDVRPPYRGTVTLVPFNTGLEKMKRVARRPTKRVMPLDYDYDSEAEWQDDEGEDLDLDDEDEEDLEDGDEVAELIDDSDAIELTRFANGLEPISTGLCWSDQPSAEMKPFRVEFIIRDRIEHRQSIDPFSTKYWNPEPAAKAPAQPSATNAFEQIERAKQASTEGDKAKGKKAMANGDLPAGLSDGDLLTIRKTIKSTFEASPKISRLGMLELLKSTALDGIKINGKDISRNDVKTVIDVVALRKMKGGEVLWSLKPGYEV